MSADMKLSVVVPFEDSGRGLENLAGSLFCRAQGVELLLCGDADENILGRLRASAGEKNSFVNIPGEPCAAYNEALGRVSAPLVMFTSPGVTFAPGAADAICGCGGACVCNAAADRDGEPVKLFRDNFSVHEVFNPTVGSNIIMDVGVIRKNGLLFESTDAAGIYAFALKYAAADSFRALHSLLIYNAAPLTADKRSFEIICNAASEVSECRKASAVLSAVSLLFWSFGTLPQEEKEQCFDLLRNTARAFLSDEFCAAYVTSAFGFDAHMLKTSCTAGDFLSVGQNVMYREVTLPILADDVVRDFYGGKLSFGTLRRSIAAWLYFKLYRMGGPAKKYGCAVCRRFVGGDFSG